MMIAGQITVIGVHFVGRGGRFQWQISIDTIHAKPLRKAFDHRAKLSRNRAQKILSIVSCAELNRKRDCACLLCLAQPSSRFACRSFFFVWFDEKTAFRGELFFDLAKYKYKKMSNELNN
jgi:hypothetical protein